MNNDNTKLGRNCPLVLCIKSHQTMTFRRAGAWKGDVCSLFLLTNVMVGKMGLMILCNNINRT